MKSLYLLCLALGSSAFAQTITFNGCHNLFDNNNYVFNKTGVDTFNKGIYITTPVTGDQDCGGLGTCEFKIQWNNTLSRWEFLADDGNGTFANPNLIYYNSTGNNTFLQNPPAITFGNLGRKYGSYLWSLWRKPYCHKLYNDRRPAQYLTCNFRRKNRRNKDPDFPESCS
ncbi:hypothetical protein J3D55_004593 [Chryseobacterium ginsenosidimutans]|uniref:hypothetical protein n=1 Tax=Chryseobacterium ginsenosidimutans TaxID=687846 RepID=UPI00216750F1|nr:hypothetical protein [Chryseobacterium ginsenosidimutans]MCS3871677.1 hypothetical protein [Chryseobacterium ginsenosidimutans]